MHFDSLQPGLSAPLPRFDEDEADEEKHEAAKRAGPVAMIIQRKFIQPREICLWCAVTA